MQEMITRSPTASLVTAAPISVIVPTPSWPRIRPSVTAGTSPLRMCRSVPQIVVVSTRTITSVGSMISGRDLLPRLLTRSVVHERLHQLTSSWAGRKTPRRVPVLIVRTR